MVARPAHGPVRRPHVFRREVVRSIKGSLGRFLAVTGIVALGCGFYAGLQMSGPDMRMAADRWYDGTHLWDLRVISTLGLEEPDLARLRQIEGVDAVMAAKTCDVMVSLGDEQIAARITALDVDAARASVQVGPYAVDSGDDAYLNRPMLREGRWPEAADECVISADAVEGFAVGDVVEVLYGTGGLDDVLACRRLRVVGTVSSSDYPYTGNFGSTTLGSGMIDEYLYVREDAFAEDFPAVEAYLRVTGAEAELSESDAYLAATGGVRERIEDVQDELAWARRADLRDAAQADLDEARADYERERADAEAELTEAASELASSRAELTDGEASWARGRAAWESGSRELASRRAEAEAQLADAERQLEEGRAVLEAQAAALATGAEQAEAARAGIPQLEAGVARAEAQAAELAGQQTMIEQQVAALEDAAAQDLSEGNQQALAAARLTLEQVEEGLAQAQATCDALAAQLAEARAGVAAYDEGAAALEEARAALASSSAELDARRAQASFELAAAQARLDAAARELASSRATLDAGWAQWSSGNAAYEEARAEADRRFADAEHDLAQAQRAIDEIELPDISVLDRTQSEGAATYHADAGRIDAIADVFPFMFFLVAALVALTTMTRMVEDDRIEIGTYKALGFSTVTIASKYLAYAGLAATTGAALGIAVLTQVLPYIITSSYAIIYAVPLMTPPIPVDLGVALAAGGLGVGVTLLATWAAVVSSLRETPATLMLPRAPAAGKRILLERVGPLWRRVSFTGKVTLRNLFRYKRRLAMTVVGIAGCTALLLVGFGLHDAIWDIIDRQYGPIIHYDTTVGLDASSTEADVAAVRRAIEDAGGTGVVSAHLENMQAGSTSYEGTLRVQVVVPEDSAAFAAAVTFKDRLSQQELATGADQVILAEKTATLLGVRAGDELLLFEQDAIGNATGDPHALVVAAVMENYVGNLVYVGRGAWEDLDVGEDADPGPDADTASPGADTASDPGDVDPDPDDADAASDAPTHETATFATLFFTRDAASDSSELATALHGLTGVSTVVFTDETIDTYRSMLSVIDLIVVVLIVSAALLALIVLYNLTNINISERVREIASLKVLGFTRGEVHAYIFRETALLALLGDALGMVAGTFLARFVVVTAEVDYVMFGRTIHPASYGMAFALTLVFTGLVLLLMRHKLDRIDMVESLKSVE